MGHKIRAQKNCSRGKATPSATTKLRLFSESVGYCQKPDCRLGLFLQFDGKEIHIAEMAHIISASDTGPRADKTMTTAERQTQTTRTETRCHRSPSSDCLPCRA